MTAVKAPWRTAIIVMGVSGAGKSTVGARLAKALHSIYLEGDSFHPPQNVTKMHAGTPLTDDDRWPWLDAIAAAIRDAGDGGIVVACSALRRVYRQRIAKGAGRPVTFVFLDGSLATLRSRIGHRRGHFMPASLLDSQLATLEPPSPDEDAIRVAIEPPLDDVAAAAIAALG